MGISSYEELKTAIEAWLDNDDLTDQIDDFIALAEARHKREVFIRQMLKRVPIGIVNRYVELPKDYIKAKKLRILETPIIRLTEVNDDHMDAIRREGSGIPSRFTVTHEIEFDVTPQKAYNGEIVYYKELKPLGSGTASNALLLRAPDIYLYSSLVASAPFLQDDERINTWNDLYKTARNDINRLDAKTIGVAKATVPGVMP